MKDFSILKKWDTQYNGAAIYSLVDDNGKRYIGKTMHLQDRLNTHRQELSKIYRTKGNTYTHEGQKLADAAMNGVVFHVEVLLEVPPESVTVNLMCLLEWFYFYKFGKIDGTYNSTYPTDPCWSHKPYNQKIGILE